MKLALYSQNLLRKRRRKAFIVEGGMLVGELTYRFTIQT